MKEYRYLFWIIAAAVVFYAVFYFALYWYISRLI